MNVNLNNNKTLIWLNIMEVSLKNVWVLIEYFENISDIWKCDKMEISSIFKISEKTREKIINKTGLESLENTLKTLDSNNIRVKTIYDEDFPKKLLNIPDRPYLLYIKGRKIEEKISIGIVGSRKATDYGKWVCKKFTRELSRLDIDIISGMAMGIDAIAHEETLNNNGNTIGVLGTGIDKIYPRSNYRLFEIMASRGTIVSEFPLGEGPKSYNFPRRNRIISGLADGLIIVEAKEKSGTLITANHALEQGKDVFAIPGPINSIFSKGTNKLIRDGAIPLLDIDDILEGIKGLKDMAYKKSSEKIDLSDFSESEIKVLEILKEKPQHLEYISYMLKMDIQRVNTLLIGMELKSVVEEVSSGVFMIS